MGLEEGWDLVLDVPVLPSGLDGVELLPVHAGVPHDVGGGQQGDLLGDQVGEVHEAGPGGGRARQQQQLRTVVLHVLGHPEEGEGGWVGWVGGEEVD